MKTDVKEIEFLTLELSKLKDSLFDFSARNPLIDVRQDTLWFPDSPDGEHRQAEKVFAKSIAYQKEYGLACTLHVDVFLRWSHTKIRQDDQNKFFTSPLLYRPCRIDRNRKILTTYSVETESELFTVNPTLRFFFLREFDLELPETVTVIGDFLEWLSTRMTEGIQVIPQSSHFNTANSWQFILKPSVGIFNYKKNLLSGDFEKVISDPNESVRQLLGFSGMTRAVIPIPACRQGRAIGTKFIETIWLDRWQRQIVASSLNQNLVIQGPPGTGKSHTILAIITSALAQQKRILFVSEKKAALDVIFDRLEKIGLEHLAAVFSGLVTDKRNFYHRLSKSANRVYDYSVLWKATGFREQDKNDALSAYPHTLLEYAPEIDGNLLELIQILTRCGHSPEMLFSSKVAPEFSVWKNALPFLLELEQKICFTNQVSLAGQTFACISKSVFQETDPVSTIEKWCDKIRKNIDRIDFVQKQFDINRSLNELTRLSIAASVMGTVNKSQLDLLSSGTKAFKTFNTLSKKYELVLNKLNRVARANAKWTSRPDIAEIPELIDLVRKMGRRSGFLSRFRKYDPRIRSAFCNFDASLSVEARIHLLETLQIEMRLQSELDEIAIRLKHDLQITDPGNEIGRILRLRSKLDQISADESTEILSHERSLDLIRNFDSLHPILSETNHLITILFKAEVDKNLTALRNQLDSVRGDLPFIHRFLEEIRNFFRLDSTVREFVLNHSDRIQLLTAKVAYAAFVKHTRFQPQIKELSGEKIVNAQQEQRGKQDRVHSENLEQIEYQRIVLHREKEQLLATPNSKLTEKQKEERLNYRAGKKILSHEMSKRRQHLSVLELLKSSPETAMDIQPLWMMNPLSVSEILPCTADLFDLVIFDEASQIPLEDSVPSVFRAKNVIVVGDMQQMPPSLFFSGHGGLETLLSTAGTTFPNRWLKWHYRSKHPDLIRFSNQVFYENELTSLPPVTQNPPIAFFKVDGEYSKGRNTPEAVAVSEHCDGLVRAGVNKIGIFAFSIEQQEEIRLQLNARNVNLAQVVLRNLENIQGIECEVVIISVGYGKNSEGKFVQNFGPVNRDMGANRLNVLFTRAASQMIVFSSVRHNDFRYTENRGVMILRDFLKYAEESSTIRGPEFSADYLLFSHQIVAGILDKNNIAFEYIPGTKGVAVSAFIQHETSRILLVDPGLVNGESDDIETLLTVLQSRYSEIKIVLCIDLWKNFERTADEVVQFLRN